MKKFSSAVLMCCALTLGCSLNAATKTSGKSEGNAVIDRSAAYTWYDGDQQHTVYLDHSLLAGFNVSDDAAGRASSGSGIAEVGQIGTTRVWRVPEGTDTATLSRSLQRGGDGGAYSPVFRSEMDMQMRALPGGVIVQFQPDWDAKRISEWLAERGHAMGDPAQFGVNFYVIATPPGVAALVLANSLYDTGEVLQASPNWWKEFATK